MNGDAYGEGRAGDGKGKRENGGGLFRSRGGRQLLVLGPGLRPAAGGGREKTRPSSAEGERGRGNGRNADLLCSLLLGQEFLFLGHDLGLVLEGEGERETDEKGRGGDDPDDVADDPARCLEEGCGARGGGGDGVPRGGGNDVDEGGETLGYGLVDGEA